MDPIFEEEQQHLTSTYAKLTAIEEDLVSKLEANRDQAAEDKSSMSEDITLDFAHEDMGMETLADLEAMNRIIDSYNLSHDINAGKLGKVRLLKRQPYFAKVSLQFKPGVEPKDVYIGPAGMTDDMRRHFIVDWRSPVAETYYNQANGKTSYEADGRTIEVDLKLRRQFNIDGSTLNSYFDTTVPIEDPLLLASLSKQRSDKMQAITATIQKEQNLVVRHKDVPVLLVNGIAGSGKTSVLLQRIAYLFYQRRDDLDPSEVHLMTPNPVFQHYIDNVLPDIGERNPHILTWMDFMGKLGPANRDMGTADQSGDTLAQIDLKVKDFNLEQADFKEIRYDGEVLITANQVRQVASKYKRFGAGSHQSSLIVEDLLERLEQKLARMSATEETLDAVADLSLEEQERLTHGIINMQDDEEMRKAGLAYVKDRFGGAANAIEDCQWLRVDRIGMRMLDKDSLTSVEWLYLKMALTGLSDPYAKYVMVDEVQDYTVSQLMVLARYYKNANFLLLGDENQAIKPGTATFAQVREVFENARGQVDECQLMTSYRSTPEITALFSSLMAHEQQIQIASVHRPGTKPRIVSCAGEAEYAAELKLAIDDAREKSGLTAVLTVSKHSIKRIEELLGENAPRLIDDNAVLPDQGIVCMNLALAKGLEFDRVIIADATPKTYPKGALSRHRLYTAISRATKEVTVLALGELTPLLASANGQAEA